jgi:hypothetical protein
MNTEKQNGYMLLFRGSDWQKSLSAEQMQTISDQWMAWFDGLRKEGKVVAGNPLEREGRLVSGKGGRVVSDGPFAESKEAIGGYFLLKVDSLDEAVTIAQECPGLTYGVQVEVRPVAGDCRLSAAARAEQDLASTAV